MVLSGWLGLKHDRDKNKRKEIKLMQIFFFFLSRNVTEAFAVFPRK